LIERVQNISRVQERLANHAPHQIFDFVHWHKRAMAILAFPRIPAPRAHVIASVFGFPLLGYSGKGGSAYGAPHHASQKIEAFAVAFAVLLVLYDDLVGLLPHLWRNNGGHGHHNPVFFWGLDAPVVIGIRFVDKSASLLSFHFSPLEATMDILAFVEWVGDHLPEICFVPGHRPGGSRVGINLIEIVGYTPERIFSASQRLEDIAHNHCLIIADSIIAVSFRDCG